MTDYMQLAIEQARKAAVKGEVPIGAVIVRGDKVISSAHNMRERKQNALAHAEVLAIKKACRKLRSWRLDDCVMYVTLEPCVMCAGAILNARISKIVVGAKQNIKTNSNDAMADIYSKNNLNWKTEVEFCVRNECGEILKNFFGEKR